MPWIDSYNYFIINHHITVLCMQKITSIKLLNVKTIARRCVSKQNYHYSTLRCHFIQLFTVYQNVKYFFLLTLTYQQTITVTFCRSDYFECLKQHYYNIVLTKNKICCLWCLLLYKLYYIHYSYEFFYFCSLLILVD